MAEVLDKGTIKALSAEARQQMVKLLAKRPYTASEISKLTGRHVTTVTQHLDILEKADLVKKKPTSKWVYYELTDKGERLFKPKFYSWVIVFSISVVFMFVGFLRLFRFDSMTITKNMEAFANDGAVGGAASPMMTESAMQTARDVEAVPIDYIAYGLIIIGLIGLVYLAYKRMK